MYGVLDLREKGFRPLAGSKASEQRPSLYIEIRIAPVSVPSRGLRHLNGNKTILRNILLSFRPLSGIKASELYILCRVLIHIQHIVLGVSQFTFPIIITLINYTIKT